MGCVGNNIGNGHCLTATISRVSGGLKANISLANKHPTVTISRVGEGLKVNIGIVCTPNTGAYIKVSPKTLWFFSEGETHSVDVVSNTRWIVKF